LTLDPFTMPLWGLIVAGSLAIGFLSAFAGLAAVSPRRARNLSLLRPLGIDFSPA